MKGYYRFGRKIFYLYEDMNIVVGIVMYLFKVLWYYWWENKILFV